MKKLFLLIALSFLSISAQAAYQVEIIIFEHLFHDAEGEVSQIGLRIPDLSNTVQLSAEAGSSDHQESTGRYYILPGNNPS